MPDDTSSWSPDERLQRLKVLEQREAGTMRKAIRAAWISLSIVAVLMTLLVLGVVATSIQLRGLRSEAASLAREKADLDEKTRVLRSQLALLDRELEQKQAALSTVIGAVRSDPRALSGVGTALDQNPRATTLVPRAYVQILDEGDRQWAKNLGDRLQDAGVIPVGVELVKPARLTQFEVRYYKKAEEEGARRIVDVMKDAGVVTQLVYLDLETNTRVRAYHFEIWCPANARATRLQRLGGSGAR